MHPLSGSAIVFLLLAVACGAVIQGSVGFGYALVTVPALALVEPPAVPATALLLAAPLTILMALRERRHIHVRGYLSIAAGRILGTVIGVWVIVSIPTGELSVLVGALIMGIVVMSIVRLDLQPTTPVAFGAGFVSGITGTAVAIGGPALAMVYQHRPGPELRSTLAVSFVTGLTLSLSGLFLAGRVQRQHVVLALELVPGLLAGLWLSGFVARAVDARWLRPAVLTFAGLSGALIVTRGILGR
ncbi:MAG TPA: sulfite exporter TauE/SafE family protein [Actinomycetota bacterium]|nr:sulfite exporter TauE/SafE family protein [Actinomycetota bacterium]